MAGLFMEHAEKEPGFIIIGQAWKLSRPGQAQSRSRNGNQISAAIGTAGATLRRALARHGAGQWATGRLGAVAHRAARYGRGSSATPTRKVAASLGDK